MTWVLLPSPAESRSIPGRIPPVSMRVTKAGRFRQRAFLVVRPALLDGGLAWWTHGAAVTVALGAGADAGALRITPGGSWRIMAPQGRKMREGRPNAAALAIPGLAGMPAAGTAALAVEFDHTALWLQVSLPPWFAAAPAAAVAAVPQTAGPKLTYPPVPAELAPRKRRIVA